MLRNGGVTATDQFGNPIQWTKQAPNGVHTDNSSPSSTYAGDYMRPAVSGGTWKQQAEQVLNLIKSIGTRDFTQIGYHEVQYLRDVTPSWVGTVYRGVSGAVVVGFGGVGALGSYLDLNSGERGSFKTAGFGAGIEGAYGVTYGFISGGANDPKGWFAQGEGNVAIFTGGLVGGISGSFANANLEMNGVYGAFVGAGFGEGFSGTATYTWLDCKIQCSAGK